MFQTKVVEKIKTHILCTFVTFLKNGTIYKIMWKNIVERAGHIWQYDACALHAGYPRLQRHSGCVILIPFALQQWLHERASLLRYRYIAYIVER